MQSWKAPLQLVLADDGSADGSLDVAIRHCRKLPSNVEVTILSLHRDQPYIPGGFSFRAGVARQEALRYATGERVLFIDPDERLEPDCVEQHVWWGLRGFDVIIGARDFEWSDLGALQRLQKERYRQGCPIQTADFWWTEFFTGNSSVRLDMILRAGGFDPTLQYWGLDDSDLGYRLFQIGATAWRSPRALVTHLPDAPSGAGNSPLDKYRGCWLHMEVLYRKYLDEGILDASEFLWKNREVRF